MNETITRIILYKSVYDLIHALVDFNLQKIQEIGALFEKFNLTNWFLYIIKRPEYHNILKFIKKITRIPDQCFLPATEEQLCQEAKDKEAKMKSKCKVKKDDKDKKEVEELPPVKQELLILDDSIKRILKKSQDYVKKTPGDTDKILVYLNNVMLKEKHLSKTSS